MRATPNRSQSETESTVTTDLNRAVGRVASNADAWSRRKTAARIELLDRILPATMKAGDSWVDAVTEHARTSHLEQERGNAWVAGPWGVVRMIVALRRSLVDLDAGQAPRAAGPIREHMGALGPQAVVPVFPRRFHDRVAGGGTRADVRMMPEVDLDVVPSLQAPAYRTPESAGTTVVLGAGNVPSLPVTDVLEQLFVQKRTVVLKVNPANEFLTPQFEAVLGPLIDEGVVEVVRGGADVGESLCVHPEIGAIQVTGSHRTLDAISFGAGEAARERKAAGRPRVSKPIHAELGDVSPVIVVPGPWSQRDLAHQAHHLATALASNASFNCATPRLIVQHAEWPARELLLDELENVLSRIAPRHAWYPGAHEKWETMVDAHPNARQIGRAEEGELPWTLATHVDPEADAACFREEPFCAFVAETALPAKDAPSFVDRAVEFVNERLWGTLSATLIVHPASRRNPKIRAAVERAVDELGYGTVGVNVWSGVGWSLQVAPWGGYPGGVLASPGSGIGGYAHNPLMLEGIEKTVVRSPFRQAITPPWFVLQRKFDRIAREFTRMEAQPNPMSMAKILGHALLP